MAGHVCQQIYSIELRIHIAYFSTSFQVGHINSFLQDGLVWREVLVSWLPRLARFRFFLTAG